jgi:glucose-6-phosphate dehydrogenase assembly protein OpcA
MEVVATAIVLLFVGFMLGVAVGWQSLGEACVKRIRDSQIERDRLANLLSRYDRCKCGKLRWQHEAQWVACRQFSIKTPADPLETVLEAETETSGGAPVTVTLGTLSEVAGRDRLRKAVEDRRKRLKPAPAA